MSNREGLALLCFAAPSVLVGFLMGDRGGFLVAVGAIAAVFGFAVLAWNLLADDHAERVDRDPRR